MSAEDRDPKFERALAQHLRGGSAASGCPDAETLAAYHERSLSLDEMAHWKQHIAGCAACQETLSLVEVTEKQLAEDWEEQKIPVLEAAAAPVVRGVRKTAANSGAGGGATASQAAVAPVSIADKRRPALIRWALPLGAVAAGVLVWIGINERNAMHAPDNIQMAESRQQSSPAPAPYDAARQPATPSPQERDELRGKPGAQVSRSVPAPAAESAERTIGGARLTAPAGDALRKDEAAAKKQPAPEATGIAEGSGAGNGVRTTAALPAPPPPAAPKASPKEQSPDLTNETAAVNAAAPPGNKLDTVQLPDGQGGNAAEDQKHVAAMKSKSAMQQSANVDTNAMAYKQGINGREISSLNNLAPWVGVILTPDHRVWWKITGPGTLELTTDAGKKWRTVDTGVAAQFASGSAPSAKVCWIAGQAGTLMLTTDRGGHWTKLTTPITGDLGGVHAADEKHATIWDSANRLSYQTSDGGVTWKQVANQ